ncbi:MAG: (2Fe-2S)-binding protein [Pararhodobacter sp.]|nr:(2Fe-2S)-binding protein [Pararhodobacter sp.]
MTTLTLSVNGSTRRVTTEDRTLLVDLLRGPLGLTGTHVGCDTSQCGACVVRLNGETVKSCSVLAATLDDGAMVETIEGVASDGALHPMQQAFSECHALQCGFCTPGFVITAIDMAERHPEGLSAAIVRAELKGNLCRCTGYQNIVAAVLQGAAAMGVPVPEREVSQ